MFLTCFTLAFECRLELVVRSVRGNGGLRSGSKFASSADIAGKVARPSDGVVHRIAESSATLTAIPVSLTYLERLDIRS